MNRRSVSLVKKDPEVAADEKLAKYYEDAAKEADAVASELSKQ